MADRLMPHPKHSIPETAYIGQEGSQTERPMALKTNAMA